MSALNAVVGRGGLLKPIAGGTYRINPDMIHDLSRAKYGEHASNLGAVLAGRVAKKADCPAYIVDPVVVDEMADAARYSGHPLISRKSIFHALNQKAVARKAAQKLGKSYMQCRLIVAHMGGGISIGAHMNGRVIDVNNALDGEGPFSPERAGGVPAGDLIALCYSGRYPEKKMRRMLVGSGGLTAYLGTNDLREIERRIREAETDAENVFNAMAYQIGKEIGAMAAALQGGVDGIVLTGGLAFSEAFVKAIEAHIDWIAPVQVFPGEAEMEALVEGAYRVLKGEEEEKSY
jgi:butyrate kinase